MLFKTVLSKKIKSDTGNVNADVAVDTAKEEAEKADDMKDAKEEINEKGGQK